MATPGDRGSAPPPRLPRWALAVRWAVRAALVLLVAGVLAGAADIALRAAPSGPTFGWPLRVVGRTNVLIMGLDRTVSDQNPNVVLPISRTDTLIAATFDPADHRVVLLSIPRDTRAPIPGHGMDKINAAHAYGGAALTGRTVENFLGVPFPYYIALHVRGLVDLVDAVGGITVRIPADINYDDNWDGLHIHLKKGNRRLGGQAAMEYTRFRHDALGDIGRIRRQQQVLNALLAELRRPGIVLRLPRLLAVMRKDTDTNLDPTQLLALGWFGARLPRGGMQLVTLPGRFEQGGAGYWLPTPEADRAEVLRIFDGIDPARIRAATIDVVNAGAGPDALGDAVARLGALGVHVERETTAADSAGSVLLVRHGDPAVARIIAAAVGATVVPRAAPGGSEFSLIVGGARPTFP